MDIKINVVKLVLGIMVVFYDIGFVIQHYCLYNKKSLAVVSEKYQPPTESSINASLLPIKEDIVA